MHRSFLRRRRLSQDADASWMSDARWDASIRDVLSQKPPIFPMVSLGLGGLGPKFPKFIGRTPSQTTKNLATCPWEFSGSKSIWRRRPPKPHRLQVSTRKNGARFSPELPPRNFGQQHAGLKICPGFPQISLQVILDRKQYQLPQGLWGELWGKIWVENPPFSLSSPLAWVT